MPTPKLPQWTWLRVSKNAIYGPIQNKNAQLVSSLLNDTSKEIISEGTELIKEKSRNMNTSVYLQYAKPSRTRVFAQRRLLLLVRTPSQMKPH